MAPPCMCTAPRTCRPIVIARLGETVCGECGLVLSSYEMSMELETRSYPSDDAAPGPRDSGSRVGLPIDQLLPNMSMSTSIGGFGKDATRLRLLNMHYNVPYVERALLKGFKHVAAGCLLLGLQEATVARAKHMFASIRHAAGIKRGAVFKAMPAVSAYFAAKMNASYRPREMVCQAFGLAKADFSKCYKHAVDCSRQQPYYADMVATVDPTSLVTLMLNTLEDVLPRAHHHQIKRTVLKLHDLVAAHAPDIVHQKDITLIAAEVLVACELSGLACPNAVAAARAGVSLVTLGRYVKKSPYDLPALQLRAYQKAEVALMDRMEAGEYSPRPGVYLHTSFGILGTKVGAGKTVTLSALIMSTHSVDPLSRLRQAVTFGTNALVVRRTITHPPGQTYSPCSLIVVPHGLESQWERELRAAGIVDYCKHSTFRPEAAACLVTATKLAAFHAQHPCVHFKRLIIDEADTIAIKCQPAIQASFTWFVTATYQFLDCWRVTSSRPIYFRCFRFFAATNLELGDIVVSSHDSWVDECNDLPPVESQTLICAMPAYMNIVMGSSLSASITEMLTAGDVEGAILAMGGDAQNEHDIVGVMTARITQDIQRLEAKAAYMQQIGHTSGAMLAQQSAQSKQQQLQGIQERLAKFKEEGMCAICMTDLADVGSHVVTSCCSHLFCGPCLMRWRCRVATCPMCRAPSYNITLIKEATAAQLPTAAARPPKAKEEALLDIIQNKPEGKFIVFSNYDRTFDAMHAMLCRHGITCRVLKGTPATFRKILADHESGRIKVLLMNSRFDGSGHSMQWVTDAVTYHRLLPEVLAQVTGRGMRPGRTAPLHMHHLRWPCEV
ncbi:hypothetical protein OEZ85_011032 [Tetradesmus obliquus]|uniref:RING-type domain-containing protein n=1 Tax=Tetradesmus obliquus TaxID=3088 RepID=A0ABY8TRD3_TETOB|nr:hypothetical protein OEZ85_011032 [Tetradesmus obliquus]